MMPHRFLSLLALSLWAWLPSSPDACLLSRDLPRFPDMTFCRDQAETAHAYRDDLEETYGLGTGNELPTLLTFLPPDEMKRIGDLRAALQERETMWHGLAEAHNDRSPYCTRVGNLRAARRAMGEAAWWSGDVPGPIPVELLRRAD